jgi:iron complex outermembrane recepter protein
MRTILILTTLCCLAVACWAQTYTLQGHVRDGNGAPIEAMTVELPTGTINLLTGENGSYSITLTSIPNVIKFSFEGYLGDSIQNLQERWPSGQAVFAYDVELKPLPEEPKVHADIGPPKRQDYEIGPPPTPIFKLMAITIPGYLNRMDIIDASQAQRGDQSSIEQGLNLVPGVKFESRGPGGSRRLAIRGGFLRSPFGVRDVKAYINGAPLTSPDGSTALELIDAAAIESMRVYKGPCASLFGPVSNGVALFELRDDGNQIGKMGGLLSQTLGAYGFARSVAQLGWVKNNDGYATKLGLTYVHQQYTGYRAQEANGKDFLQLTASKWLNNNRISANLMLYQGFWELPGGLDRTQATNDPRQALAISQSLDAHVARRHLRVGLGFDSGNSDRWLIRNSAYLHLSDKENPFGTSIFNQGYKIEASQGLGIRSVVSRDFDRYLWRIGGEYQCEWLDFAQYDNLLGQPGPLNTRYKTFSTQTHAFTDLQKIVRYNTYSGEMSISKVAYHQTAAWSALQSIPTGKTQLTPTLAAALDWNHNSKPDYLRRYFLRVATGYSPPALWEMTDTLGQLRTDLKPETGINVEARGVFQLFRKRLKSQFNIYHHTVFNTIVPQNTSSGRTLFENQGRTTQIGLEGFISRKRDFGYQNLNSFAVILSGAYQYFYFNDYQLDGVSFNGKMIPGVPRYTLNLQADLNLHKICFLQLTHQVVGRSFLNNANTVLQQTYNLLGLRVGHAFGLPPSRGSEVKAARVKISPFGGINNLLNARYTNFPQLNAAADRYYNPAPGINWFAGLDFKF